MQPEPEPKHRHPRRAPKPGVAGCKQSTHTSTRQEWRGAAAQTHTPTMRTQARSGGVAERPHQHTHSPTPQPGVAGCSRNPSPNTHTQGAHPSQEWRGQAERPQQHTPGVAGCSRNPSPNTHTHGAHASQEWRGASGAPTQAHARSGGLQPKPEPKHTHTGRAPQPGVAGCKRAAHTSTRQEWSGAAETGAQTHTPAWRTQARSGRVQAEPPHQHRHSPTAHPGVAGRSRNPSPNTHNNEPQPSQEWRGSRAPSPARTQPNTPARSGGVQPKPAQTHTPTARTPARSGGVQAERPHQHTPEVAGCSQKLSLNTHTHGAHPSQEWQGASGAPTPAHTQPNTPARSGGVQPKPEPKHRHPRRAPQPGVAGCKQSAHTSTRQAWRGAAKTRAKTHTPTARTQARSGGVQAERTHQHTPGVAGAAKTRAKTHTPTACTQARSGGVQAERQHQHTPGVARCS